jgi:hypothetical protein
MSYHNFVGETHNIMPALFLLHMFWFRQNRHNDYLQSVILKFFSAISCLLDHNPSKLLHENCIVYATQ